MPATTPGTTWRIPATCSTSSPSSSRSCPPASVRPSKPPVPAEVRLPLTALPPDGAARLASAPRAWATALLDWLIPSAAAAPPPDARGEWQVRLRVENPQTGAKARALLGQRHGAAPGYDLADLTTLAPFASPYLTLVFPRPGWGANKGDYASDFRPAAAFPDPWLLELRADPVGATVVLRWEGDPAILARSRLTDGLTGQVIDPDDPVYATGYPLTLTTKVRTLTWEYFGDRAPPRGRPGADSAPAAASAGGR